MALNITINKVSVAASFAAGATVATAAASGGTAPYVYSLATGGDKFDINSSTGVVTTIENMNASNIASFSVTATDSTTGTALTITSDVIYPPIQAAIRSKFNRTNVIYKITKDIDLGHGVLTILGGCTLDFQGGSFSNGTITFNNTIIKGNAKFDNIISSGTINSNIYGNWFGINQNNANNVENLTALFNFCKTLTSKKNVIFGEGNYNTSTVYISDIDNIYIKGRNTKFIYIGKVTSRTDIFSITADTKDVNNIVLDGLSFNGGFSNVYISGKNSYLVKDILVQNCTFSNSTSAGIWDTYSKNIRMINNRCYKCGDNGLYSSFSEDIIITSNIVENCYGSGGIVCGYKNNSYREGFEGGRNILIEANNVFANYSSGEKQNQFGIDVTYCDNCSVIGNTITTYPTSVNKIGNGIACEEWYSKNVVIKGNTITNVRDLGITLGSSVEATSGLYEYGIEISNNTIKQSNQAINLYRNAFNVLIKDNYIERSNKEGIYIDSSCSNINIISNVFKDCSQQSPNSEAAIRIQGDSIRVINNTFIDSQVGGYLEYSGTGNATISIDINSILTLKVNDSNIYSESVVGKTWKELKTDIDLLDGFTLSLLNGCEDIEIYTIRRTGTRRNSEIKTISLSTYSFLTTPEPVWYIWNLNGTNVEILDNKYITNITNGKIWNGYIYNGNMKRNYFQVSPLHTNEIENYDFIIRETTNLNDLIIPGVYTCYNSNVNLTNLPDAVISLFTLQVIKNVYVGNIIQIMYINDNRAGYIRVKNSNSWSSWTELYNSSNKSGTTSNRPTSDYISIGYQYYDITLGKYICWDGAKWINLDGTALA